MKEDYQKIESEKTEIETELLKKGSISTDNEVIDIHWWAWSIISGRGQPINGFISGCFFEKNEKRIGIKS